MIEVERGGKHSDEFELEFKPRVAAIEGLGRVGFEWGRRGLDARKASGFIRGTLCHGGFDIYQLPKPLQKLGNNNGLTPVKVTGARLHETSTRIDVGTEDSRTAGARQQIGKVCQGQKSSLSRSRG